MIARIPTHISISQRLCVISGLLLVVLAGLFPPGLVRVDMIRGVESVATYYENAGPQFLFLSRRPEVTDKGPWLRDGRQLDSAEHNKKDSEDDLYFLRSPMIDYPRLCLEWVLIFASVGIVCLLPIRREVLRRNFDAS